MLLNTVSHHQQININICESEKNISVVVINKTDNDIQKAEDFKNEFHRQGFYKEGFGLGLWIADQLMQMNYGKLLLEFHKPFFIAELIFFLVNK